MKRLLTHIQHGMQLGKHYLLWFFFFGKKIIMLLTFMNDIQHRLGLRGDWPELRTALAAAPTPGPLARLFHWQAL